MAAHRFYRVHITKNSGSDAWTAIKEIELRTALGGADVTGSGTASASNDAGGAAANAVDNNTGTMWIANVGASDATPVWWKYDFGAGNEKDIIEARLTVRDDAWKEQNPAEWQLQWSDNDADWTPVFSVNNGGIWGSTYAATFNANMLPNDGATKTFWRIKPTAVDGGDWFGLVQINMRTEYGGASVCTGGTPFSSSITEGTLANPFDADETYFNLWVGHQLTVLPDQWIGYKFTEPKEIVEVAIKARADWQIQSPKDFKIQYWDAELASYVDWVTVVGSSGWENQETRIFQVQQVRSYTTFLEVLRPNMAADTPDIYGSAKSLDWVFEGRPFYQFASADPVDLLDTAFSGAPFTGTITDSSNKRYWRVYVEETADGDIEIDKVVFKDKDGVEISTGGRPIASSGTPGNVFDADAGTVWTAPMGPAWIGYDFGEGVTKEVKTVEITASANNGKAPGRVAIEHSSDKSAWTTKYSEDLSGWTPGQQKTVTLPANRKRTVVLICN